MTEAYYTYMKSPLGRLMLVGRQEALAGLEFPHGRRSRGPAASWQRAEAPFRETIRQLAAYFAGELMVFDLTLAPYGSPFQMAAWEAMRKIPYGETRTYADIAGRIGKPAAARAVGAAAARNPLPIVIPCHRVVGSGGKLTGFGGGLDAKRWLLTHEGALGKEENLVATGALSE